MHTLRRHGYVETESAPAGIIVRIAKAKNFSQAGRNLAERLRKVAGAGPQNSGGRERNLSPNQQVANWMGSSFVARSEEKKERETENDFHRNFRSPNSTSEIPIPNSSSLDQTPKATPNPEPGINSRPSEQPYRRQDLHVAMRLQHQLLGAEREEAVRRELAVGTGPEVHRP
jgi:hypothetical protein